MLIPSDWTSATLGHLALWIWGARVTSLRLPLLLFPYSLRESQRTRAYARTI